MSLFDRHKPQHPTTNQSLNEMAKRSTSSYIQQIVSQGIQAEMDPVNQMTDQVEQPDDARLPLDERLLKTHKTIRNQCRARIAELEKLLAQQNRALRIAEAAIAAGQQPENLTPIVEAKK